MILDGDDGVIRGSEREQVCGGGCDGFGRS